jgi:hypothetical protein
MIDLLDANDGALHVIGIGNRSSEGLNAEINQPTGNRGGHHSNVFDAIRDQLSDEMRA